MSQFINLFGSPRCSSFISNKSCKKIAGVFVKNYPQDSCIYKKILILYQHQKGSSQGTADMYESFEVWLAETLLYDLGLILREQILPDPCSPICPCCSVFIREIRNRKAERVHELLSQLCKDPNSGSELLKQYGKKAFENAWKRYFGELKKSKADTLESFSPSEEKAKVETEPKIQGGTALGPSDVSHIDDGVPAIEYD
jgi:hypothetical protein